MASKIVFVCAESKTQSPGKRAKRTVDETVTVPKKVTKTTLRKLHASVNAGDCVQFDTMLTIGSHWHKVWPVLASLLNKGVAVTLVKEEIALVDEKEPVAVALKAVAEAEGEHQEQVSESRRSGVGRAAAEGKSNWKVPSQAKIRAINRDMAKLKNVTAVCEKHEVSRSAYYEWKKRGVLNV